jgi:hypothetical protein
VILILLVAFPSFWREIARSMGPGMVGAFMGFIAATVMFAVGAGIGLMHLASQIASSVRRSTKPASASGVDGVWDRELDL